LLNCWVFSGIASSLAVAVMLFSLSIVKVMNVCLLSRRPPR
jgi:hypothetical protein